MARWTLIVLVLALGLHHTALVPAAPASGHHAGACAGCVDDHPDHSPSGMFLAACLALLAPLVCVPSLRRHLTGLLVAAMRGAGRTAPYPVAIPRGPPGSRCALRLCVMRC